MTMIELIVHMDCAGCELKIKKALQKLKGVDDVDVNMNLQKVTVMGWADQAKILKIIKKTGMKADLWPYTPQTQHNDVVQEYYHQYYNTNHFTAYESQIAPSIMSYNYLTTHDHYYDEDYFGSYNNNQQYSTLVDNDRSSMFSDENPHACSIM